MSGGKNLRISFCISVIILVFIGSNAEAAWVWTPQMGRWLNPKRQPRETAALQFQYAEELLAQGDIESAMDEYRKVLRYFPESNYCDLAQYSIGRALEAQGEYEDAIEEYQKVIDDYPNSQLFGHVLEKQRKIADRFFELGVEREEGFILFRGSNFDKAIEIYRKVINNQPFTDFSAEAQYRIGLCYMKLELYEEASVEFQKVLDFYPASSWSAEAAYACADSQACQALPHEYDKTAVEKAVSKYETFLRMYPESSRIEEAQEHMRELLETAARHEYQIGMYYHDNLQYDSARLYFKSIVDQYPRTQWAEKAQETLDRMSY
ncbi:MAG: outer membrane protein assembly factor BamD [Candidatus Abyssobacteria bacterium SURF_5]|uniref:Outer membrane protein assembly factor BamD n=1 Tax=Abyssobacteria bacterium (strain SURF_5) TaxID=2093360 RepID=A0A3A4NVK8_ABYX5|nr:MAG: outer membrane protein assembly factor BamD [Candidatus Abyssubacteria bacterium SURF_5]